MWTFSGLFRCENFQACLGVTFSGLFRCEKFQAYLGVKISGLKFSGVKFFNPPYLAQFQPNLHVKILAWSHVKISGLKQVWFTCENRCDRFGTGFTVVFSVILTGWEKIEQTPSEIILAWPNTLTFQNFCVAHARCIDDVLSDKYY